MATVYKFTNPDRTTHGGCEWVVGEWQEASGEGLLCGPGWLHAYETPEIAEFMDSAHGKFGVKAPLWICEAEGESLDDQGLKIGYTRMRLLERVERKVPTDEQRVEFAIRCAAAQLGVEL